MAKNGKLSIKSVIFGLIGLYFGFFWADSVLWSMVKEGTISNELYTTYWYPIKCYVAGIADYFYDWYEYLVG